MISAFFIYAIPGGINEVKVTEEVKNEGTEEVKPDEQVEEKKFTQADLDKIVKDRLQREKDKAAAVAKQAAEQAEAAALESQKEFEQLATKRAEKITTLETDLTTKTTELEQLIEQLERYKLALSGQLTTTKEGLPESTLELLNRLDEVDQLEYLTKHGAELRKPVGVPPLPKPKLPEKSDTAAQPPIHINF